MKAVQIDHYHKQVTVHVREIAKPVISPSQVLIKVVTAAINPLDLMNISGEVKLIQPLPLPATLGNECAGIITQVGDQVTDFKPGDRVFTRLPLAQIGAFAEFVAVDHAAIAKIPEFYDFPTSVIIPLTGLTAYQALTEELGAQPGETVLIPGGSGSFGQIAVPIAKALKLKVIVTGNARARNKILAAGADRYLDYRKENYWEQLANIDYVIDALGARELEHELSVLKPGGKIVSLRAMPNRAFAIKNHFPWSKRLLFSLAGAKYDRLAKRSGKEYRFLFVHADGRQLEKVAQLLAAAKIIPEVDDHRFTLDQAQAALEFVKNNRTKGKVIFQLNSPAEAQSLNGDR